MQMVDKTNFPPHCVLLRMPQRLHLLQSVLTFLWCQVEGFSTSCGKCQCIPAKCSDKEEKTERKGVDTSKGIGGAVIGSLSAHVKRSRSLRLLSSDKHALISSL